MNVVIDRSIANNFCFNLVTLICFTRSHKTVYFNYNMNGTLLNHLATCKDSGTMYDARFALNCYAHFKKMMCFVTYATQRS